jgi:hypothetical protein
VKIVISVRQFELIKACLEHSQIMGDFILEKKAIIIETEIIKNIDIIIDSLFDSFYDTGISRESHTTNIGKELLGIINLLLAEEHTFYRNLTAYKKIVASKSLNFLKTSLIVLGISILCFCVPIILAVIFKKYFLLLFDLIPVILGGLSIYVLLIFRKTPRDLIVVIGNYLFISSHQVEIIHYGKSVYVKDKKMVYRLSDITDIKLETSSNRKHRFLPNGKLTIYTNVGMTCILRNLAHIEDIGFRLNDILKNYRLSLNEEESY